MPPAMAMPRRVAQKGVPTPSTRSLSSLSSPCSTSTLSSSSTFTPYNRRPQCPPQPRLQLQTHHARSLATPSSPPSQRTVFIHIRPPPQTLAERRAVLRVVERHGKTELFKKTASNDSFICIASTADMADTLVAKSPFAYDLADSLATVPFSLSSRVGSRLAAASASGRNFVVSVFPAAAYPHRTAIRNGPLYGPWPEDIEPMLATSPSFKNTFTYNALRGVVPESASADALCDWRPRIAFGAPVSNASEGDGHRPAPGHMHESKVARIRDRKARRSHATRSVLAGLVDRGRG